MSNIVSNLDQKNEQSEDNLELVANVFEQIDTLIESGNISVSPNVSQSVCKDFLCILVCASV